MPGSASDTFIFEDSRDHSLYRSLGPGNRERMKGASFMHLYILLAC